MSNETDYVMPPTNNMASTGTGNSGRSISTVEQLNYENPSRAAAQTYDDVERTKTGIPLSLLWIPYVTFSCVVVGLMLVSFIRFHQKHGHKYKQRQNALWRQLNNQTKDLLDNIPVPAMQGMPFHLHGGTAQPPNGGVSTIYEPGTSQANHSTLPEIHIHSPAADCKTKKSSRKRKKPINFKSNANGSMVDLRVGDVDNAKMFKTGFLLGLDNDIWTSKSSCSTHSPPPYPDSDDEDIMLIQQTKV